MRQPGEIPDAFGFAGLIRDKTIYIILSCKKKKEDRQVSGDPNLQSDELGIGWPSWVCL